MKNFTRSGIKYDLCKAPTADNFSTVEVLMSLGILTAILMLAAIATGGLFL